MNGPLCADGMGALNWQFISLFFFFERRQFISLSESSPFQRDLCERAYTDGPPARSSVPRFPSGRSSSTALLTC